VQGRIGGVQQRGDDGAQLDGGCGVAGRGGQRDPGGAVELLEPLVDRDGKRVLVEDAQRQQPAEVGVDVERSPVPPRTT
jgi:hypothetical protein